MYVNTFILFYHKGRFVDSVSLQRCFIGSWILSKTENFRGFSLIFIDIAGKQLYKDGRGGGSHFSVLCVNEPKKTGDCSALARSAAEAHLL